MPRSPLRWSAAPGTSGWTRRCGRSTCGLANGCCKALGSDRYFALLDRLDELAADPPWTEKASKPVDSVLRARVRHDYKRLVGRVEFADEAEDSGEREHRLHEARKAAKRVRVRRRVPDPRLRQARRRGSSRR